MISVGGLFPSLAAGGGSGCGGGVSPPTSLACVLCCLVCVCLPLLWARQCALPFVLESYRFKPSSLSDVRGSRCPTGRLAPRGRTVGGVRRASLLLLLPWLAVCTAAGTICSNVPTVCDGSYSGTSLCALPPTLSPPLNAGSERGA